MSFQSMPMSEISPNLGGRETQVLLNLSQNLYEWEHENYARCTHREKEG